MAPSAKDAAVCARILNGSEPSPAQHAQDTFAFHNLFASAADRGFYVDSGANEPMVGSNTWIFDRCLGWRGLCVEPNPKYHARLAAQRSCTVVPSCLGDRDGQHALMSRRGPMSQVGGHHHAINVTCSTLRTTLRESAGRASVDLWSLDVEGLEMKVLKSWSTDVPVAAILVEDNKLDSRALDEAMRQRGYKVFARWLADTLYVRRERAVPASMWCPPPAAQRGDSLTRMTTPKARLVEREAVLTCPHAAKPRKASERKARPTSAVPPRSNLHGPAADEPPLTAEQAKATQHGRATTKPKPPRSRAAGAGEPPRSIGGGSIEGSDAASSIGGEWARQALPQHVLSLDAQRAISTALDVALLNGTSTLHLSGLLPHGSHALPCPSACSPAQRGGRCDACGAGSFCCRRGHNATSSGGACKRLLANLDRSLLPLENKFHQIKGWLCIDPAAQAAYDSPAVPAAFAYNPALGSDGSVALNVRSMGFKGIGKVSSVWMSTTGTVRHVRVNAEDARLVTLRGEPLSLFTRYRAHQARDLWIGSLRPPYREVKLLYDARAHSEGNWLPFVYNESLFITYSICPHLVLHVELGSGLATEAYRTHSPACAKEQMILAPPNAYQAARNKKRHDTGVAVLRGSAMAVTDGPVDHPSVARPPAVIGLAHTRRVGGGGLVYRHHFVRRSAIPPFEILGISRAFTFPQVLSALPGPLRKSQRADDVQYCLSFRVEADGSLIMGYSAGDSVALVVRMPRALYCKITSWC